MHQDIQSTTIVDEIKIVKDNTDTELSRDSTIPIFTVDPQHKRIVSRRIENGNVIIQDPISKMVSTHESVDFREKKIALLPKDQKHLKSSSLSLSSSNSIMKVDNIPDEYPLEILRKIDQLAEPLDQSVHINDDVDEKKLDEALDKILLDQIEQNKKHIRPTFVKEPAMPITPKLEVSAESALSSENSSGESQYKAWGKRELPDPSPSPDISLRSYSKWVYLMEAKNKPLEKSAVSITPADTQVVTSIPSDVTQRSHAHTLRSNKNPVNEPESTSRSSCCNCFLRLFNQNAQSRKAQNHLSKTHMPNTDQLQQSITK
jgi:hypothetical protein